MLSGDTGKLADTKAVILKCFYRKSSLWGVPTSFAVLFAPVVCDWKSPHSYHFASLLTGDSSLLSRYSNRILN